MNLVLVTAPASEPVTLEAGKAHLRVDISDDDDLIEALITAAREYTEEALSRALFTQTWDLYLDGFPTSETLVVPKPPLQSVTSVTVTNEDGESSVVDASRYVVSTSSTPGRIVLKAGESWTSESLQEADGVKVRFVAGWSAVADIPQAIKQAMLLLVGHWYENREDVVVGAGMAMAHLPLAYDALLTPYRVRTVY